MNEAARPAAHLHPQADSRILRRDEGEEALLFDPANGAIHSLNPTARQIWELCDGTRTAEDIAAALCEQYDLPADQGHRDVVEFLDKARALGIVTGAARTAEEP